MIKTGESVQKSLATKRAKFSLEEQDYTRLQKRALELELGLNNYSKFHSLAKGYGIDITQNRCRTLLKDVLSGLAFDEWLLGQSYKEPNTYPLSQEDWALARTLSSIANNNPHQYNAIIEASRQVGDLL